MKSRLTTPSPIINTPKTKRNNQQQLTKIQTANYIQNKNNVNTLNNNKYRNQNTQTSKILRKHQTHKHNKTHKHKQVNHKPPIIKAPKQHSNLMSSSINNPNKNNKVLNFPVLYQPKLSNSKTKYNNPNQKLTK